MFRDINAEFPATNPPFFALLHKECPHISRQDAMIVWHKPKKLFDRRRYFDSLKLNLS